MKAEKFIKDHIRIGSNEIDYADINCEAYEYWLTPDHALAAVDIAREELVEWLEENIDKYIYITGEFAKRKMFEDFRKVLEK